MEVTDFDRVPPHDLDAEEAVLGSMLISLDALETVAPVLTSSDFYREEHRDIYRSLLDFYSQGKPPDPILIGNDLVAQDKLESVGGKAYLTVLINAVPTAANAPHYAEKVKDTANRRRLIEKAAGVMNLAYGDLAPQELLARLQGEIQDRELEVKIGGELVSEQEDLPGFMERLETRQVGEDFIGLDTGFIHFNRVCNGLGQGLFVIAGAPSCGKTTLVKQIVDQVAEINQVPCLFFSLEQSAEELRVKTLSRLSGVENRDILRGRLEGDTEGWERVKEAGEIYGGYKSIFIIEADQSTTVDAIRLTASRAMRYEAADRCFIAIDYLQKMPAGRAFDGAKERMDFLTSELRRLSRALNSPVLVISSENRMGYKKKGLDVFKESGEIEYSSDIAGVLLEADRRGDTREVDLHIVKNRNGERSSIKFDFVPHLSTFREIDQTPYMEEE